MGEEATADNNLSDPWTPDQESALLKALIQYKPVGLHAHFRMIGIRNSLLTSGTIDPEATHTRIPGIWTKLKSLYDIEQLNEREDEVFTSLDEGDEATASEDETKSSATTTPPRKRRNKKSVTATVSDDSVSSSKSKTEAEVKNGYWRDFELSHGEDEGGFEALMWDRRLNPEGSPDESDWETRSQTQTQSQSRAKTNARDTTDELRSSPVGRGTRSGRKGRVNKLKDEMEIDSPTSARGSRRTSKTAGEVDGNDDEDQTMDDASEEDEEGDEDEDEDESGEDDQEEKRAGGGRRGRGAARTRGQRGRRRK